jgi:glycosyltransferase involved in cell wall biosynthesis
VSDTIPVSILILTNNEEQDLPACLESVAWSTDIHVFDSFSTDRTVQVAREFGAAVAQRKFDGYATQRNAALTQILFKYSWVLILDADERVPHDLMVEISALFEGLDGNLCAYRIRRRDFLWGRWLKHAQISPFYVRLVRPEKVRYEREVNEVLLVDGPIGQLRESFDHFPFSKGISHWVDKHNRYSTMEARRCLEEQRNRIEFRWTAAFFSGDFSIRRYHQKGIFYRLPCRPLIKLIYMLLMRRAFMDGYAGISYAILQAFYEYLIVFKQRELSGCKKEESCDD